MSRPRSEEAGPGASIVQTLDRGITALEIIAGAMEAISVTELAQRMNVSKSIAYRLVRTLEYRNLVRRTSGTCYVPSLYLGRLGAHSYRPLKEVAAAPMRRLADAVGHTAYISMRDGDEIASILVQEPSDPEIIAYRPSARHPIERGSDWVAWLAGQQPGPLDTREVLLARERGYSITMGEVIPGLTGMSSPIVLRTGECIGIVSVLFLNKDEDTAFIGHRLITASHIISDELD